MKKQISTVEKAVEDALMVAESLNATKSLKILQLLNKKLDLSIINLFLEDEEEDLDPELTDKELEFVDTYVEENVDNEECDSDLLICDSEEEDLLFDDLTTIDLTTLEDELEADHTLEDLTITDLITIEDLIVLTLEDEIEDELEIDIEIEDNEEEIEIEDDDEEDIDIDLLKQIVYEEAEDLINFTVELSKNILKTIKQLKEANTKLVNKINSNLELNTRLVNLNRQLNSKLQKLTLENLKTKCISNISNKFSINSKSIDAISLAINKVDSKLTLKTVYNSIVTTLNLNVATKKKSRTLSLIIDKRGAGNTANKQQTIINEAANRFMLLAGIKQK